MVKTRYRKKRHRQTLTDKDRRKTRQDRQRTEARQKQDRTDKRQGPPTRRQRQRASKCVTCVRVSSEVRGEWNRPTPGGNRATPTQSDIDTLHPVQKRPVTCTTQRREHDGARSLARNKRGRPVPLQTRPLPPKRRIHRGTRGKNTETRNKKRNVWWWWCWHSRRSRKAITVRIKNVSNFTKPLLVDTTFHNLFKKGTLAEIGWTPLGRLRSSLVHPSSPVLLTVIGTCGVTACTRGSPK